MDYKLLIALFLASVPGALFGQEKQPSLDVAVRPGFEVELIRSAGEGEDSWISMTFDPQGRILVGLDSVGVGRITLPANGQGSTFERVESTLKHCRGVLYSHDSMYVSATNTPGFFRLRDTTGDDRFDEKTLLKSLDYRSRYGHGSNQIVLGPDQMIYLVVGNDVSFPEGIAANSPYRNPQNDKLLPSSHDAGQDNRVGTIQRISPDGTTWEILAGGFRNQVDLAFDRNGEMFTYDADMEWDAGLPWYRPTRLNHVVSGGEYGWRWGTMKWPTYYQDSLPTTLDTGYGSPTGMVFGTDSNFPARFRDALYMADWQNGRIYLVDLIPDGASFRAEYDIFLQGGPLNVCDLTFGPDGSMYFITGGRGSQSGLYRVRWTNKEPAPELPASLTKLTEQQRKDAEFQRLSRRQLEQFHRMQDPIAIDAAWHHLASPDRWLRSAARIALENQEVKLWKTRALEESTPLGSMTALLALARAGEKSDQTGIFDALTRQSLEVYAIKPLLGSLRVYALSFIRQGRPSEAQCASIAKRLDSFYPHDDVRVNRELSELLVYLKSPTALEKTLSLLQSAPTQEEQIHYATTLVQVTDGWSLPQRKVLLDWLQSARRLPGGKLVKQTVRNLTTDALNALSERERAELAEEIALLEKPLDDNTPTVALPIVKQWTLAELTEDISALTSKRDRAAGEQALAKASCLKCHVVGGKGGRIGPDLSSVGKRFDLRVLLESVIEPSRVIDEKYRTTAYVLTNGKVVTGRPIGVNAKQVEVELNPLTEESVSVLREEIEEAVLSPISPMPTGLVNVLTREEILDLISLLKYRD